MTEKIETLQDIAMAFVNDRTESSFNRLYHRLRPGLRKMIQKYHTDPETIADILAITLSKAYVFVDKYDSTWNFSTWVYRICQNECLMELRRKASTYSLDAMEEANIRVKPAQTEDWMEIPNYEFFEESEELPAEKVYDEVMEEISALPAPYRDVLQDREIGKLKYEEIAEKRKIKINTVRSRIHVAKKLVKNKWIQKKRATNSKPIKIKNVTTIKD